MSTQAGAAELVYDPYDYALGDAPHPIWQRLRDEAHRFAIGAHRSKRAKSLARSSLDLSLIHI